MAVTTASKFVFDELSDGSLAFVGDFDGLYQNEDDPWDQSGIDPIWKAYYQFSRTRIKEAIAAICGSESVLEVGCGIGFVVEFLAQRLPDKKIAGMDISSVAVDRANSRFPEYQFIRGDITSANLVLPESYGAVILNQLLWYVLNELDVAITNCFRWLEPDGLLIFSQAFLREKQRYGADIVDGCEGLLEFMDRNHSAKFSLVDCQYDDSDRYLRHDGLLIYRKS